jgi:hypothetical protein
MEKGNHPSSLILRYLQVCPSLRRMLSVMAWPDREVPPARNVTGVLFLRAARMSLIISSLSPAKQLCQLAKRLSMPVLMAFFWCASCDCVAMDAC